MGFRRSTLMPEPGSKRKQSIAIHHRNDDEVIELTEEELKKALTRQELMENHKEKTKKVADLKQKNNETDKLLHELQDNYSDLKANCGWCLNTEDIALCVEDTLESYKKAVSSDDDEDSLNSLSPISRLLRDSRRLSSVRHEDMIAGQMLAKMSNDEIIRDMVRLEEELTVLQSDFDTHERKMTRLSANYDKLSAVCFLYRFSALNEMIELATVDCLKDE